MSRITGSEVKSLMEAPASNSVLGKKGKDWYSVTKDASGKITGERKLDPSVINPAAMKRYEELRSQVPAQKPKPPAQDKGERKSGESLGDFARRQSAELQKDYPTTSTTPASQPPAQQDQRLPVQPAATTQSATTQVRPTTQSATTQVRPTAQPKIEKSPSGYAVGSIGGTKFERRAATSAELKAAQDARKKALASAPTDTKGAELAAVKAGVGASKNPIKEKTTKYDAFDLVLEYLLSEGHTDTLDEALYVMMEMDPETIQSIYEAASDQSDKQIDKGVRKTYAGQAELDNQRSRGLNKLPATQRAAKEKRMRARLKARRDDLFGERNRREDAAREEIRKKYGL